MTTPTRSAPSATGRQLQKSQKSLACPTASSNRRLHRYADPRRARRATAPERAQAAFSFGPCTARFLFHKMEKKMGGASRWTSPLREQRPGGRRPAARITLVPLVAASQQIVGSNAEVIRQLNQVRNLRIKCTGFIILICPQFDPQEFRHLSLSFLFLFAQQFHSLCKNFHISSLDMQVNCVYNYMQLNCINGDDQL